jgi:hypothetical protein
MPRPRKNDPTPIVKPILLDFAREIATAVERITLDRVRSVLDGAGTHGGRGAGKSAARVGRPRGKRAQLNCYYPGCKNVAAPRFGMFCSALHKDLPAAEKEKYRKAHSAGTPAAKAAKRTRRSKKK